MDTDLNRMTREGLIAEVKKLRAGIREHRDCSRHELCWHHPALWALLPEKTDPIPVVPEWPQFLEDCLKYRQSLDGQAPTAPDYVERRKPFREAHLAAAQQAHREGRLVMAGAFNPPDRALLIFRTETPAEVEAFAKSDPLRGTRTRQVVEGVGVDGSDWTTEVKLI